MPITLTDEEQRLAELLAEREDHPDAHAAVRSALRRAVETNGHAAGSDDPPYPAYDPVPEELLDPATDEERLAILEAVDRTLPPAFVITKDTTREEFVEFMMNYKPSKPLPERDAE